ncbi:MAG: phenylacetate--CoA ligase family protein [Desulfomonilaceae bacterium]
MRGYLKALLQRRVPAPVRKWAQLVADRLPPSVRYGRPYRDALALLSESETWDEKTLADYQEKRLQIQVDHCYANVPYYREVFQQNGLAPRDIRTVDDLQKLPFLTKEIVRKRKKDLIATNISLLNREEAFTSGSTGAPLDFYMDPTTRPMERALAFRHLLWLGFKKGDRLAVFKMLPLADPKQFYQYVRRSGELRISVRDMDEPRLEKTVDLLEQFKPDYISAWPSSLYILARWMERNKRSIQPPKFIVTGSENMYPHMTERIEEVFKAPVSDFYGQEESVAIAMQCAMGEGYHIQMEMGVVELLPFREGMSEIVGTGLHNMVMPFLRYRTGDLTTDGSGACPCGRKHPLISTIIGREADLIVTPEGKLVSPLLLNPPFHRLEEIKEGQIIQEDDNTLRIIIVPWERISESTREQLGREISDLLASSAMKVIIEEVEGIPRTGSCKQAFVVSRIRLEDYL